MQNRQQCSHYKVLMVLDLKHIMLEGTTSLLLFSSLDTLEQPLCSLCWLQYPYACLAVYMLKFPPGRQILASSWHYFATVSRETKFKGVSYSKQ